MALCIKISKPSQSLHENVALITILSSPTHTFYWKQRRV